ncbi:hypothetical protein [Burkholderia ubonensis]|uniref:hypothetical protein n=1 Tax=Burkholderia ubonensis TaxID=101571 RepID=UPI000AB7E81B|nr:hypothetical protein [Burkholderia ubonensis]
MSVNVKQLFGTALRGWIARNLADGPGTVDAKFWVVPVHPEDPEYDDLATTAIDVLNKTKLIDSLEHESLVFVLLADSDGTKLCIGDKELPISNWDLALETDEFSEASLNFLQRAHITTKHGFAPRKLIPYAILKDAPVYEDDLLDYLPEICILKLEKDSIADGLHVICLKALIAMEGESSHVYTLREDILNVGYSIPAESHDWIFGQLYSAVRSRRLANFYLELYKLFEFFFPIDSILNLADRLGYNKSELALLEYCRGTLSWNVNHQRGARSAAAYATTAFAEVCLGETFVGDAVQATTFKERAIERLTTTRHVLTHQDFRPAFVPEVELKQLTEGMLLFLRDAFSEYASRLEKRRKRYQDSKRPSRAREAVKATN